MAKDICRRKKSSAPIDSRVMVCVDSITYEQPSGDFYHFNSNRPYPFCGLSDLLLQIDELLDQLDHPQSSYKKRVWDQKAPPPPEYSPLILEDLPVKVCRKGKKATFSIFIMTRQHGTWQGEVTWFGKDAKICFRSAIELLWLLHCACESLRTVEGSRLDQAGEELVPI